jgi:hypothetical protein
MPVPSQAFEGFEFYDLVSLTLKVNSPGLTKKVVRETHGLRSLFITAYDVEKMEQYQNWENLDELAIRRLRVGYELRRVRSTFPATTALNSLIP